MTVILQRGRQMKNEWAAGWARYGLPLVRLQLPAGESIYTDGREKGDIHTSHNGSFTS